jgi:AraC family transcriptional regulator, regulatory protein of adaptative response / methylated-DNA-[protein]-cysteine methyltransferase
MPAERTDADTGGLADPHLASPPHDYQRIHQAIEFLVAQRLHQPSLAELAAHLHLSEFHLQRLFSRWAGVSPKQFVQYLTKEHAKQLLSEHSVQDTALTVGLSGPSRLHDLMIKCEAVTPGEYQRMGPQLHIVWGVHASPFGHCLLASTPRGICFLAFFDTEAEQAQVVHDLHAQWGRACLQRDDAGTLCWVLRIFGTATAATSPTNEPLSVLLKGSPFQLKVWEALLRIPSGQACTYGDVAMAMGQPSATRAVASSIARNQIGYLIPCHRVIRNTGEVHAYRWGGLRKRALLAWESAQASNPTLAQGLSSP